MYKGMICLTYHHPLTCNSSKILKLKILFLILHVYIHAAWDLHVFDCLVAVMITDVSACGHKDSSAVKTFDPLSIGR